LTLGNLGLCSFGEAAQNGRSTRFPRQTPSQADETGKKHESFLKNEDHTIPAFLCALRGLSLRPRRSKAFRNLPQRAFDRRDREEKSAEIAKKIAKEDRRENNLRKDYFGILPANSSIVLALLCVLGG
jgi:hypothetical protein